MAPILSFLVATLACFTMAAQSYIPLNEIPHILETLGIHTSQQNPSSGLGLIQRIQDREEKNRYYDSEESKGFHIKLNNVKILNQFEDDLQQVLTSVSDRKCKGNGQCDCPWAYCDRQDKVGDKTATEIEKLFRILGVDIYEERNRNFESNEDRRQNAMKPYKFRDRIKQRKKLYYKIEQRDRHEGILNLEDFDAIAAAIRQSSMRSRLFPLTANQKQRRRRIINFKSLLGKK